MFLKTYESRNPFIFKDCGLFSLSCAVKVRLLAIMEYVSIKKLLRPTPDIRFIDYVAA